MVDLTDLPFRIPAGIAYVWGIPGDDIEERLLATGTIQSGAILAPGLFAFAPAASSAEVIEAAIYTTRTLIEQEGASSKLRALIFPGTVELRDGRLRLVSDGLVDDLRKAPPDLPSGVIHLTGHATRELESPWILDEAPTYAGPSGRSRTLWATRGSCDRAERWRNPKVLRRTPNIVSMPLFAEAKELLASGSRLLVLGHLGVGKSRLVAHIVPLSARIWARCWSDLSRGPSLASQLAKQLDGAGGRPRLDLGGAVRASSDQHWLHRLSVDSEAELRNQLVTFLEAWKPEDVLYLVLDDLHQANEADRGLVEALLAADLHPEIKMVLIGRRHSWLEELDQPSLEVRGLDRRREIEFTNQLVEGLSFPEPLLERFREACQGNPFAAEEGLHNLVRRRLLRERYGNFFYSGPKDAQYLPTARLNRHLLAEALRTNGLEAAFRLAAADGPTPVDLLARTCESSDETTLDGLVSVGLITRSELDHEDQLDFALPAYRRGLRQCLEDHVVQRLRGEILQPMLRGSSSNQLWSTYQKLAGTPPSTGALLEVLALDREKHPNEGLFEALEGELQAHRGRRGDPATEFELLWYFLPLARKHGDPTRIIPEIERALALCHPGDPRRTALLALHSEESLIQGELEHAERRAVEGLDLARKQDPRRQSILLLQLGKVLQRQDRHPEAKRLLLDLLTSVDQASNPVQHATCHFHLGNIFLKEQDFEAALDHHQTALRQRRAHGPMTAVGQSLTSLAALNLAIGNYSHSLALFHEALEALDGAADPSERAFPLSGIGKTRSRLGDFSGATKPFKEALELRTKRADKLGMEISRLALAQNDLDLGKGERALQETRQILFRLTMLGSRRHRADAESLIGQLLMREGKAAEALEHLLDAAQQHRQTGAEISSLFDESFALQASIDLDDVPSIELRCQILAERLATAPYPELGERLDLSLHRGWEALRNKKKRAGDSSVPLERSYRELCRKTAMLEPERRNQYLSQVPANREILERAQAHGFSDPSKLEKLMSHRQQQPV